MVKAITTDDLTRLAAEINTEHRQCLQAMRASLTHAVKVGDLLNQAKTVIDHGDWLPWIAANCEFSERTARAYMRVSRSWPQLQKTAGVADLTISGALRLLQASTDGDEPGKPQERASRSFAAALFGDDKARAYDGIMAAARDGYIDISPIGLKALPKLEDTGKVDEFWIGLMAELLIVHGKDHEVDPPDSVKWWIGDWMNYGKDRLPDVRESLDLAMAAAYYMTTPEGKALLDLHEHEPIFRVG